MDIRIKSGNRFCFTSPVKTEDKAGFVWYYGFNYKCCDGKVAHLELYREAAVGATAGKTALAKKAKELGLDAIHDTVHEMARDEARHGKAFKGLLDRYFGK